PPAAVLAAVRGAGPQPRAAIIDSPYRGLAAFEEQDAGFFFGREAAAIEVLDRMARLLTGAGLLVVSGVSGAGKSSLLRAGVLPRIRAAGLAGAPAAAAWPGLVFTPTPAPLGELALQVAVPAGASAAAVRDGASWRPTPKDLRSPRARPRWPGHPGWRWAREQRMISGGGGCCWWWTSSRSCSPKAPMRGSGGRSSPPCTRPPQPRMGLVRH